jgi:hypothetical protein
MVLRHAHLPPANPAELAEWSRLYCRRRRRASDACVSTSAPRCTDICFSTSLASPADTRSQTSASRAARFTNQLLDAAEAFIHDGPVVL